MSELQINTNKNVKIMFNAAGAGERLLAFLIDTAIKIGYMLVLNWTVGAFDNMDEWSQIGINTILSFPVMFYTLALESLLQGQTIGKRVMKIKVVNMTLQDDGGTAMSLVAIDKLRTGPFIEAYTEAGLNTTAIIDARIQRSYSGMR